MSAPLGPNLKIVSAALLGSTILYIVVAFVMASSNGWAWSWAIPNPTLMIALAAAAFVMAGAALLLKALPLLPRLALAEAVGVMGLVAAFVCLSPLWVLPFAGLSILLQIFLSPLFAKTDTSDLTSGS